MGQIVLILGNLLGNRVDIRYKKNCFLKKENELLTILALISYRFNTCTGEKKTISLHVRTINMSEKAINRIKVILAEKRLTNKWLAAQLGKTESTVSRWCTNEKQPTIETFIDIANVLDVDVKDLLVSTK